MSDTFQKLAVGDIIETNYNTGPYRIVEITRGCTCASYLDTLNNMGEELPPDPEHIHLTLTNPNEPDNKNNRYWINRYLEENGRFVSADNDDEVFVVGKAKGQLSLF